MTTKLKAILLMIALLILAYAILSALMGLAEIEASKADDYFFVKAGWVSEPVLSESEEYR